jgi:aminopeptidase N
MTGIYPCFYKHGGKEKVLVATQFESHHAREAFPCIDEPEAKTTFDLTLVTPKDESVLSNTPIKETKSGSSVETIFETTPRMSTYLLAFVFGDMQHISSKTKKGTEVSVWSTPAQPLNSLEFGLKVATDSIEFFEDYFGVDYPLPKADHVALPDFSAGAMENWGLITYRERLLLAYPEQSSQSLKELIATVITHETSHQWFGNLVTMRWWDDLWLNESFADMMEYQAVDAIYPEWHIWDSFTDHEGLAALRRDSIYGVQAVKCIVKHPDEINSLFDPSIVYAKGGRLLFMLKNYIGEDAFRRGLTNYFTKHAYQNTEGADLWKALSEASGIDVEAFMNPWLKQSGFPVLKVEQEDKNISLSQEHFLDNHEKIDKDRLWPIPLFASSEQLPKSLAKRSLKQSLATSDYVYFDQGAYGHYIVDYKTTGQQAALAQLVSKSKIESPERLMVLNAASMLSRAGYHRYGDVLKLLAAYSSETNEAVWDMIALVIGEARRFIDLDENLEDQIKQTVAKLIANRFKHLGWEEKAGESSGDNKLRATIISLGAYAEESSILEKSKKLYAAYLKDNSAIAAELRATVLVVAIKQKIPGAFKFLVEQYDKTDNGDLKGDITAAITATRDKTEAKILLGRLTNPDLVKPQDCAQWLIYLLRNRYVRDLAWDWLVDNWSWIEKTFNSDKSYDDYPRYAAGMCNTKQMAEKYRKFFEPKQTEIALSRNISIGLEEIDSRVAWLERDLSSVQEFFK